MTLHAVTGEPAKQQLSSRAGFRNPAGPGFALSGVRSVVAVGLLAAAVVAGVPGSREPARAAGDFTPVSEFRPFPRVNGLGRTAISHAVDADRRRWFFTTSGDASPTAGNDLRQRVWLFDLDALVPIGAPLVLPGGAARPMIAAVDPGTGVAFISYAGVGSVHIAVIGSSPTGPVLLRDWDTGPAVRSVRAAYALEPRGVDIFDGKAYLALDAPNAHPREVGLIRLDMARLIGNGDPLDWRFSSTLCPSLPYYNGAAAVGKSRTAAAIFLPCRAVQAGSDLQGVVAIETGDVKADDATKFVETYYPISGDYGTAESFFDPVSDRLAMRRVAPAQLVVFDGRHRRWGRPVLFGQNNLYQSGLNRVTGRLYGQGNDPGAGDDREFVYVPELRTTPPQNGLFLPFPTPSPGSTSAAVGTLAIDERTDRVFVADVEPGEADGPTKGLFFHVYQETR
ncbi:MAG: hypothetical protein M3394_04300, partial [Actinomycetota bacterium]|nr:hypothetical protein [Actinomycetota bacterium]